MALLAEFFVPGLGSIYGDHPIGALITWGVMIGGIIGAVNGLDHHSGELLVGGLLVVLGGRIYGFVDAYQAVGAYNQELAQRLGLPPGLSVNVAPLRGPQGLAIGPRLRFSF